MTAQNKINVQGELENKNDNRMFLDNHRKGRVLAQNKKWWLYVYSMPESRCEICLESLFMLLVN